MITLSDKFINVMKKLLILAFTLTLKPSKKPGRLLVSLASKPFSGKINKLSFQLENCFHGKHLRYELEWSIYCY